MEQGQHKMNLRKGYWYFHDKDGKLEMEGHSENGKKVKW